MGVAAELAALDRVGAGLLNEGLLKLVFAFGVTRVVMQGGVVEDDACPVVGAQLYEQLHHVGFAEVVGEHLEGQCVVVNHFLQQVKDAVASGEAKPVVLLGEREVFALVVGAGLLRGVEQ